MSLLRVLTFRALPAVELVRVVHRARYDVAIESYPAGVADGTCEAHVQLRLLIFFFLRDGTMPLSLLPGSLSSFLTSSPRASERSDDKSGYYCRKF